MATTAKAVDFSNVKDGGGAFNRNRIPAGDYIATITKVEDSPSKKDDVFQYLFSIKIDKYPTRTFPYYCKLQENQLWKLRNLLIAAGLSVPKRKVKVDPNKAVGKRIGVTIEDAEYDNKEQSEVAAVFPAAELVDGNQIEDDEDIAEDDEDIEDEDAVEEEPEDEDEAADPLAELDRTEIKAEIKKFQQDFVAKKSQTDDDLRDILRGLQGGGVEEDEDEEDEEPAPKPAAKKRPAAKKPAVTDEDLEDLDIDEL